MAEYGYRNYAPEMGRWVSRDPIGEEGGLNLCSMVSNDPVNAADMLGLLAFYAKPFDAAHAAGVAGIEAEVKLWNEAKGKGQDPGWLHEHGGRVCSKAGSGFYTTTLRGAGTFVNVLKSPECDRGDCQVGWWHTHPGNRPGQSDSGFSEDDKTLPNKAGGMGLTVAMTCREKDSYVTYAVDRTGEISDGPKTPVSSGVPKPINAIPKTPTP